MTAVGFVGAGHIEDRGGHAWSLRETGAHEIIADLRDLARTLDAFGARP